MTDDQYRILAPSGYKALLQTIPRIDKRFLVECMMNTGMRYEELRRFGENPRWFRPKERTIVLPASSTKTRRGRTVHLTPQFSEKLEIYLSADYRDYTGFRLKFPGRANMNKDLSRWAILAEIPYVPVPKTFRKTWETWLIFAGYDSLKVAVSQGHTQTVQIAHYQNLIGSLKNEVDAVKELTRGWMT